MTSIVPKQEEAIEEWRKLHNKLLHNVYVSANIVTATE
jgi:hypothetical protein